MAPNPEKIPAEMAKPVNKSADTAASMTAMSSNRTPERKLGQQPAHFHSYENVMHRRRELRLWAKEPWCLPDSVPFSSASEFHPSTDEPAPPKGQDALAFLEYKNIPKKKRMQHRRKAIEKEVQAFYVTSDGTDVSHPIDVVAILVEMSNKN